MFGNQKVIPEASVKDAAEFYNKILDKLLEANWKACYPASASVIARAASEATFEIYGV